ncbi:MAG: PD40 domain-containing protein [Acidobacteria bacterium]|nr:PD40 domain-containing protein [Acidobacteriota bacterium]
MAETPVNDRVGTKLDSWKEIALYLQRDVSTVRRWEKYEGLPVRRHEHRSRSSVYAIAEELDAWRAARQPEQEAAAAPPIAKRLTIAAAVAVALLGSGWTLWRRGALHWPYPLVEAAETSSGKTVSRQLWASKTSNLLAGEPSADGRLAVFTDWSTGDLAAIELATGKQLRLTREGEASKGAGFAQSPVIAPDGQLVAYSWYSRKAEGYELHVVGTAEGSVPRALYRNADSPLVFAAGWSRDGKQLLVKTGKVIGLLSVERGEFRAVRSFSDREPGKISLSPDGRYIAYDSPQSAEGAERDIFFIASDGSREVPLVRHPAHDTAPVWTPDGKRVLFFSDRNGSIGLWSVTVGAGAAQGTPSLVHANAGQMTPLGFDPKGGFQYALPGGADDLLMAEMDMETGRLLSGPAPAVSRYGRPTYRPYWSPDGHHLAYAVRTPSAMARGGSLRIVVRDVETGREREIGPGFRTLGDGPRWRPDGKTLLVFGLPADGRARTLQLDVADGSASTVPECPFPQWSTATDAVWCVEKSGLIRRQTDSGAGKERVQFERTSANAPVSPDGRWLVFRNQARMLNLVPIAGGPQRQLLQLDDTNDYCLASWTPDSRNLLCPKNGQVWRIPIEGGDVRKLAISIKGLRELSVHPDGKRVAIWAQEPGAEIWVLENFLPRM